MAILSSPPSLEALEFAPPTFEALRDQFSSDLRHRRHFVAGKVNLVEREPCVLVIVHPQGGRFLVRAEVVYVKSDEPGAGVGLDLIGLDAAALTELEAFVRQGSGNREPKSQDTASLDATELPSESAPPLAPEQGLEHAFPTERAPLNLYERVRRLSLRERETVARQGTLAERVALERTFGGSVWESLLQNPQLSVPEVAHISRNGTLPIPLAAIIAANSGWLAIGEVRRALLSNPRVSGALLDKVLKATPRAELKQIAQSSPYRHQVRAAAKKLIGE